jgi:hypothetical protein
MIRIVALATLTLLVLVPAARATEPRGAEAAAAPAKAAPPPRGHALDRLQLDATAVTGNRELPKVMSIVPWKAAEPPAGPDRPMGSLIEEVLSPLDRDEFRREITYFGDLTSQSADRSSPGVQQP